jgi:hypothetical protein
VAAWVGTARENASQTGGKLTLVAMGASYMTRSWDASSVDPVPSGSVTRGNRNERRLRGELARHGIWDDTIATVAAGQADSAHKQSAPSTSMCVPLPAALSIWRRSHFTLPVLLKVTWYFCQLGVTVK